MYNVYIELEENYTLEPGDTFKLSIIFETTKIGYICGSNRGDCLNIELIAIEPPYRNFGCGTQAMNLLIEMVEELPDIKCIRGECPNSRVNFYERLGSIFECRDEYDEDFINNVFYIDL